LSKTKRLCLYLHTHWDREWYLAFEEYRTQLTLIVADIVDKLERGQLPSFMLDGQSCILEDLEQVDTRLTERVAALMASGRVEAGPWYVLADQLLVSGESLLRNLEMGLAVTRRFGPPTMIGYCPDTFGHTRDLPRILQSFGITTAIVWRGVPDLDGQSLFWWTSADGSKVLTYHLSKGYYQTAFFEERTAENLAEHLLSWRQNAGGAGKEQTFDSVLVPVGGDHLSAPPDFMKQLQSARLLTKMESLAVAAGDREATGSTAVKSKTERDDGEQEKRGDGGDDNCLIEANSLRRFVELMLRYAGGKSTKIPSLSMELRDNLAALQYERAYMLQGVLSTRLYLKRDNRLAERRLSRILEPAFALLRAQRLIDYPQAQLKYAWRLLMQNHPHDSICGCSVDEVHREMQSRTSKFNEVLNVLERASAEALVNNQHRSVLNNFRPFRASLQNPLLPEPESSQHSVSIFNLTDGESLAPVSVSWCEPLSSETVDLQLAPLMIELEDSVIQRVDRSIETYIFTGVNQFPETREVIVNRGWLAAKEPLPSFGYRTVSFAMDQSKQTGPSERAPSTLSAPATASASAESADAAPVEPVGREPVSHCCRLQNDDGRWSIENDRLFVAVDADGCLNVELKGNSSDGGKESERKKYALHHKIKDLADAGDTYNFDALAGDSYAQARLIEVLPGKRGPLVSSLILKYELGIAEKIDLEPSVEMMTVDGVTTPHYKKKKVRSSLRLSHVFKTEIELRRSLPILFFETTWENRSRDHRLEVFFETGGPVKRVFSENHFSLVEREIVPFLPVHQVAPGTEAPLDRYPCQRFFIANDQIFLNTGLPEFGASGTSVSMTILRAVSALSRSDLRSRGGGAGPALPTPEANCLGLNKVTYGWAPLGVTEPVEAPEPGQDANDSQSATGVDLPLSRMAEAYNLAQQYENLSWTTFAPLPLSERSFLAVENAAVKVVATRIVDNPDAIEFRLLNISFDRQSALLEFNLEHCEAMLTTADGRVIEILNALKPDASSPQAPSKAKAKAKKQEPISCAPDVEECLSRAAYKVVLGANALVSVRLRLPAGNTGPGKVQGTKQ
jgi:mannosylglycerate hydrolase